MDANLPLILIVISAALHATWNALFKAAPNRPAGTAALGVFSGIIFTPLAFFVPLPNPTLWGVILLSTLTHGLYQFSLSRMMAAGDYSFVYPIARGTGPLVVTLFAVAVWSEPIGVLKALAILTLITGAVLSSAGDTALKVKDPLLRSPALPWALTTGLFIGGYTLIDAYGMKQALNPLTMVVWTHILFAPAMIYLGYKTGGRGTLRATFKFWRYFIPMSVCSLGGYTLALYAYRIGNVSEMAALRETSIFFAALIGVAFLGEKITKQRLIGILLIAASAIAIKFIK